MTAEPKAYDVTKDPRTGRPSLPIDAEKEKPGRPDEPPGKEDQPPEIDLPGRDEEPGSPDAPAPQHTIPAMKGVSRQTNTDEIDKADGMAGS